MKNEHTDDTFLSRWLNNDLTNEELVSFKQTEAYKEYQKIINATQNFNAPNFNKAEVLEKIIQKTTNKKVKKLLPNCENINFFSKADSINTSKLCSISSRATT